MDSEPQYKSGHPPHDVIAGLRVGGVVGGLIGLILMWILGAASFWFVAGGAVVGASVGYLIERRNTKL
ncbi:MAG: hypothetical protein HKN91_03870 [Acidimicrobiia bacterium]|nr:hypothetical protein [Acidimicrobiia bacterium]